MIDLFGSDQRSLLGVAAMLESERIPYRRTASIERAAGIPLLVAGDGLSAAETAAARRRPALVLGGGPSYAREVLGAVQPCMREGAYEVAVGEPLWAPAAAARARALAEPVLRMPLAPACIAERVERGSTMALIADGAGSPAAPFAVRQGAHLWTSLDLGAAFANLLSERYLPAAASARHPSALAQTLYYAAPAWARRWAQSSLYRRAERRRRDFAGVASRYPVDASGWLLLELFQGLLQLAFGAVVRAEHWPAPFGSAATLTHDLEPARFPYTRGLDRLLGDATRRRGHALGVVATPCRRYLSAERRERLAAYEVYCHGLTHRGDPVAGRERVEATLRDARRDLETSLGKPVRGYRSPRLDRSSDLAWALDRSGFEYDSSFPDVDRENLEHFGGGVRWNLPYRPLIDDGHAALRFSRCLELPLTAPDCIQPLYAGDSPAMLRDAIRAKAEFVRRTSGVYVSLVHAGVFGERDAALREELLAFVAAELCHEDTWLATPGEIADWWRRREQLHLELVGDHVRATNAGTESLAGACVVVERGGTAVRTALPPLAPGESRCVPAF